VYPPARASLQKKFTEEGVTDFNIVHLIAYLEESGWGKTGFLRENVKLSI